MDRTSHRDPYASPSAALSTAPALNEDDEYIPERVGGLLRTLAAFISLVPYVLATELYASRSTPSVLGAVGAAATHELGVRGSWVWLAVVGLEVALEAGLGASFGFLVLGLRVGTETGRVAPFAVRLGKAFLIRLPEWIAIAVSFVLLVTADPDVWRFARAVMNGPVRWSGPAWLGAVLLAFTWRRQTAFDRILKLAVYRRRELRPA